MTRRQDKNNLKIKIDGAELIELKRHAHKIPECPGLDLRIQKHKGEKPLVCTKHELDWLVAVFDAVLNDPKGYPAIEHNPWKLIYVPKSDERWAICRRLHDRLKQESERLFRVAQKIRTKQKEQEHRKMKG